MIGSVIKCIQITMKSAKTSGLLFVISYFIEAFCYIIQLFLLQKFINVLTSEGLLGFGLYFWLLMYIVSFLFETAISYIKSILELNMSKTLMEHLSKVIYAKLSSIDYCVYENDKLYNIVSRMGNAPYENFKIFFLAVMKALKCFIVLLGTIAIILQFSITLTFLLIVILVLVIVFSTLGMNILNNTIRTQTVEERWSNYYKKLFLEKISNFEIRINNASDYILQLRKGKEKHVVKKMYKSMMKADFIYNISTVLVIFWSIYVIIHSENAIINGKIAIGVFTVVIQTIITLISNVENMSYSLSDVVQSARHIDYYNEFMDLPEGKNEIRVKNNKHEKQNQNQILNFDKVTFSYDNNKTKVINQISFNILEGEKVAIVGENGAGKSTIFKLACGLLKPTEGNIYYNSEFNQFKLGVVFQNYAKYFMTLRENIALSDTDCIKNEKLIEKALNECCIQEFLSVHPRNLDVFLGTISKGGIELSGGQWQRIAVARGVFNNPNLLLMDEPTSSMDPVTESKMYEIFAKIYKNKTCIIISHRLATAKMADRIILIENGIIREQGTHDELMQKKDKYYSMFQSQASWYQ